MNEKDRGSLIPQNKEGKKITASSSAHFGNHDEAAAFYQTARERLLSVGNWHQLAGRLSPEFMLTDEQGNEVNRIPREGDYFRIDIPGPGSQAGEGYDWARVEGVNEVNQGATQSMAIMVRPASNPKNDDPQVAHFLSGKSSSTFMVALENNLVTASIYDRNIEANEETKKPVDKLRNALAGFGAKHGFSKWQWQTLTDAIVENKKPG
jgi:hypothetical protein